MKLLLTAAALAIRIVVDHNAGADATPQFKFTNVASPMRDDAAAKASLSMIAGAIDGNSGGLAALNDGELPTDEDQPVTNLFFKAGSWGGRFRFDFAVPIDIAEIRSYSWHPDSRAPQVYKVFGSDESDPNFNALPSSKLDPATCGWKLIAFVDTRTEFGDDGGQYAVSISNPGGAIGRHRYLLFDLFETESDDPWGNTFYSEIDVIGGRQ